MIRRIVFLLVCGIVWLTLLCLFASIRGTGDGSIAWHVWLIMCGLALSSTAMELTLVLVWFWRKYVDPRSVDIVPPTLTSADKQWLATTPPRVAMLMPAHREASTVGDSDALVQRLFDLVTRTPEFAILYLLFDSPGDQQSNELEVIERVCERLRRAGRPADVARVRYAEYRAKRPSRRNKPGSILHWLERFGDSYKYMFILDGDSSLPAPDACRPKTRHVLERLIVAMERNPDVAMIQAEIQIARFTTLWGAYQQMNCRFAARYHGPLYQWLLEDQMPSFGHNICFHIGHFRRHACTILDYLSHDHLESAELASASLRCVISFQVETCEETEEAILGDIARSSRWARGNAQWCTFLFKKRDLPLGPWIYLGLGILNYVWPLIGTVTLIAAVVLLHKGVVLVTLDNPSAIPAMLGLVITSLLWSKLASSRSVFELLVGLLVGGLMAPALMLLQGMLFLIAAFGSKWTIRNARSARLDWQHVIGVLTLFLPVSLLGATLLAMSRGEPAGLASPGNGLGIVLVQAHIALMVLSPAFTLLFSAPLRQAE